MKNEKFQEKVIAIKEKKKQQQDKKFEILDKKGNIITIKEIEK